MKLFWEKKVLNLREPFTLSYGAYAYRSALRVELREKEITGFGECVEISYYGIDLDFFIRELLRIQHQVEAIEGTDPKSFYEFLLTLEIPTFLLSALDSAYWDLYGKVNEKKVSELLGIHFITSPISSLTISALPLKEQKETMEKESWPLYKVKLNGNSPSSIKKLLSLGKNISLDGNTSLKQEDLTEIIPLCQQFHVPYVEQPLEVGKYNRLPREGRFLWMADEDLQSDTSLDALVPYYSGVNIKVLKAGGITPALEQIQKAKALGLKVLLGCMTETTVGLSAAFVLSPLADYLDLDGAYLLSNDDAVGSYLDKGEVRLSKKAGLGFEVGSIVGGKTYEHA